MYVGGLIHRAQLLPINCSRLLVIAPAGFGKTSLLRQWAEGKDALWLTATVAPEGREQLVPALGKALGEEGLPLEALLPKLHGRTLVLDDLQFLTEPKDHQALELLIEAAESFALAMGTRTEPNLPALHRCRVRQQLSELSAEALGFQGEDLRRWMEQMLPAPLAPESCALLEAKTGGWAAALVLTAQRLSSLPPAQWHAAITQLSGHSQTLYDYLASEVLETLPPPLRQFLLEQCVLPTLEPTPTSRALLRELERRRLVLPRSRGGFTLHALFAEFLQARYEEEQGTAAFQAHCDQQAQRLWEAGQWESAFRLWWSQGFSERIAAALAATYQEHLLDYFPWVKLLPLPLLERYPLALRLRGVAETETRGELAEAVLLRAEQLLPPEEIPEARLARVRHYRYTNHRPEMLALLHDLAPVLTEPSPLRVRLLQEWAFYHYAHAELGQASRTLDEAILLLQKVGGTSIQQASVLVQRATMTDLWQGDFARVRAAMRQIEALFSPQPPPIILAFLSVLEAEVAFHTDSPDRVPLYERLRERARAVGYPALCQMAEGFLAYEDRRQGRYPATEPHEAGEVGPEYSWLPSLIALYKTGNMLEALPLSRPGACLWWRFAEPLLDRGQGRQVLPLLETAYLVAEELGNPFARLMACYWSALVQPGHPRLQECLELVQAHGYEEILLWQPQSPHFLTQALAAGVAPELTRALLERQGTTAWCVRGFGGLQVEDQKGTVHWPRPKARALFALLWLAEGRPLLVEQVVAALWPQATGERGRQSYRTHCTYLRQALGGDCLNTTAESIRLVLPEARFEDRSVLLRASQSKDPALWQFALERVGNAPFLPEFLYDDWSASAREHYHRLRQELRVQLAQHLLQTRRPEEALSLCRTMLQEDRLDEDAALTGVMALVARERIGEARNFWERFVEGLADTGLKPTLGARQTIQKMGLSYPATS